MAKMTGGEALVQALAAQGVDTIFALPGVQNDAFFNALYDYNAERGAAGIRVIHARHEQGTAYMALGYALSSGRVGVYSVVPGPGVLNTTAALSTAYAANAPVLCLTGQIRSDQIGRGYGMLHELPDQLSILRGLTQWADRVRHPSEVPRLVGEAWQRMLSGRPRPVALEASLDVLAARAEVAFSPPAPVPAPPLDQEAVEAAANLLVNAERPLIFVGGGAQEAGAEVLALAELLHAPVIATYNGRGVVDSRHELSFTMPAGHRLWAGADVVIGIGTRLMQPLLNWGTDDKLQVIRIDVDPEEMARISAPAVGILAPSQQATGALVAAVEAQLTSARPDRRDELAALRAAVEADFAKLQPQMGFLEAIRDVLPEDGFFVEEMTQVGYVARVALPVYRPRTYISTGYQGTLGWGLATGLGVKVANPDRAVITVSGDGGFLFTVQELATAVQHGIATVNLVFNDGAYGNVLRMQRQQYGGRVIASELRNPDFVKLAESFGAVGLRAHTPDEVNAALRQGLATTDRPTVIEVPVGEMPSPWSLTFAPRVRPVPS